MYIKIIILYLPPSWDLVPSPRASSSGVKAWARVEMRAASGAVERGGAAARLMGRSSEHAPAFLAGCLSIRLYRDYSMEACCQLNVTKKIATP